MEGSAVGSSVFLLSQAMGGGKTHSMIALGLLARDPELRRTVLAEKNPAPSLPACRVIGFNGRSTDAPGGIWGSIALQLGKAQQFSQYVSPLLQAPGPEAWKQGGAGHYFRVPPHRGAHHPVNPNGDELYHILQKRLFAQIAPEAEIQTIAAAYREALREANKMNLTSTSPEALYSRVCDAYPFHPDLGELMAKFKENEGFQQTRGVIRLMQMLVASLWNSQKAKALDLIHPYDLDLNLDEIASEVRTINPSLSAAIAHDVAHGGALKSNRSTMPMETRMLRMPPD